MSAGIMRRVCVYTYIERQRERGGERTPQRDVRLNMRRHRSQSFVLEPLVPRHDGAKPLALMHTQKSIGIHADTNAHACMRAHVHACVQMINNALVGILIKSSSAPWGLLTAGKGLFITKANI